MYLNKLNKRIDTLVEGLKKTDQMMSKMVDQKSIIDQIKAKKNNGGGFGQGPEKTKPANEFFKEQVRKEPMSK